MVLARVGGSTGSFIFSRSLILSSAFYANELQYRLDPNNGSGANRIGACVKGGLAADGFAAFH